MQTFQVGKTYQTRSIGDYNCIISATIHARTAKTIVTTIQGQRKTFRVKEYEGVEQFMPWGNYSMCPSLRANQLAA